MVSHPVSLQIGEICCTPINDGTLPFPAAFVLSNLPDEQRAQALTARNLPVDQIDCPYTCLLIRTPTGTVLLDTGAGAEVPGGGKLLQNLESAGVRVGDVDTVILSHAHPDHIAGILTTEGEPTFPNARIVMWRPEWDFWTADQIDLSRLNLPEDFKTSLMIGTARRCLPAVEKRIELIDRECEIVPGVNVLPAPGHTPGHAAVHIASGRSSLLCLGDAVFHPLHLENPEWQTVFDLDQDQAASTRRRLLDRASADRITVMAYHFPFPGIGHIATRQHGWGWEPAFPGEESFTSGP